MFKLALIQLKVTNSKSVNLEKACKLIKQARKNGATVIMLPELFTTPYKTSLFKKNAEYIPKAKTFKSDISPSLYPTCSQLSQLSSQLKIYLIGGSLIERDSAQFFNTAIVFGRNGDLIAKHRKINLFDVNIPGKLVFRESRVLTAGTNMTVFDTEFGKFGLAVCYDMRFPNIACKAMEAGTKMMLYPAAFNLITGPLHWDLLIRSRANDNQFFVAACSPAKNEELDYKAYGHSMAVDPWGRVLVKGNFEEEILYCDVDFNLVESTRKALPVLERIVSD